MRKKSAELAGRQKQVAISLVPAREKVPYRINQQMQLAPFKKKNHRSPSLFPWKGRG